MIDFDVFPTLFWMVSFTVALNHFSSCAALVVSSRTFLKDHRVKIPGGGRTVVLGRSPAGSLEGTDASQVNASETKIQALEDLSLVQTSTYHPL